MIDTVNATDPSVATGYGSNSGAVSLAFDESYRTAYSHFASGCFVGLKMTGSTRVRPTRMRFYPQYQTASSISNFLFEGSTDGGASYIPLASGSSAHEGWNFVDTNATSWFTHLRYRSSDSSSCRLSELKFVGIIASSQNSVAVSVKDTASGVSYNLGNVSYADITFTPIVTSISPSNGTSLGGTSVTLSGYFGSVSASEVPSVALNGINCSVVSWSATAIQCITGYRGPDNIQSGSVTVVIPGLGQAASSDGTLFLYMDRWSDLRS
jgi:hypothetical protein